MEMKLKINKIRSRNCPVCDATIGTTKKYLDKNYDLSKVNSYSFSSRKNPEFMCHNLVLCTNCDLVYADRPPNIDDLSKSYHNADYDSNDEAIDAAKSYSKSLKSIFKNIKNKNFALEIGTGNGAFLDELKGNGFSNVTGIEPSVKSIESAPDYRKKNIINNIFNPDDFDQNSFDLVCCFMTLEHVLNPKEIAFESKRILKDGGAIAFIVHDHRSLINRLLGKKSPIIDIEHMQIFSKKSIKKLLYLEGYQDIVVRNFKNTYSLKYWVRLMPINNRFKIILIKLLSLIYLDNIKISLNVGNLLACGYKQH
jgi:SAM-dependent methyltransferase